MASKSTDKVPDKELAEWLRTRGEDQRELVVQAKTPPRRVTLAPRPNGRVLPTNIEGNNAATREKAVSDLARVLAEVVDESPVILQSAGAVVVKATGSQANQFANHPLVKAIYPNRRLGKRGVV